MIPVRKFCARSGTLFKSICAGLCLLALTPVRAFAVTPEIFETESELRSIDTVELFRNGIYWWASSACSETSNPGGASFRAFADPRLYAESARLNPAGAVAGGFTAGDLFGEKGFLSGRPSFPRGLLLPGCSYGAYFARDDEAFYYVSNRQLHRKPLTEVTGPDGPTINTPVGIRYVPISADGALFANETELWFYSADLPGNNLTIYSAGKRGNTRLTEAVTIPGLAIRKFTVARVIGTDGNFLNSLLIILTPDGRLYQSPLAGPAQLIRTGVSDFALRDESYLTRSDGVFVRQKKHSTTLYYALGNPITYSGPGQLIGRSLNPGALADFVEFDAGPGFRVTSVAVDTARIFLTRTPLSGVANSDLLRRRAPPDTSVFSIGDPDYSTIALQREFRSLRSNGRSVYFAHGNTVQRLSTEAPAINLDFGAFGIEVTQGIQTLDNRVRLVAGKPAVVRGYGEVLANTSGLKNFDVPARLNVFSLVGGVATPVPGSPFLPVQAPILVAVPNYSSARTNLNATYQFQIPAEVIQPGRMRFQLELNPGRSVPETGNTPLANNSSVAELAVVATFVPNIVFAPMKSSTPSYNPKAPDSGFWDIIARAKTLLPLPNFRVLIRSGLVSKPKLTFTGIKARSFDVPDEADTALFWLGIARGLDVLGDTAPGNSYYVGMFPPDVSGFNGLGNRPGHALVMRMASDNPTGVAWNSIYGGRTLAHELSHNLGRKHIQNDMTCSTSVPSGPFDALPGGASACTMGETNLDFSTTAVGFDPISWNVVLPGANGDLLSYANTRWISEYNWNALIDVPGVISRMSARTDQTLSALANTPLLLVHGFFNLEANAGGLFPAYTVDGSSLHPEMLAELTAPAPADALLRIQLINAAGEIVVDQPVQAQESADEGPASAFIQRAIPMNDSATKLRLVFKGASLAEVPISAHSPAVILNQPVVEGTEVKVSWTGSDADGDSLYYTVQYSADDGKSWHTLNINTPESTTAFSTDLLAGTEKARIRVTVSDGVLSTAATSEPFSIPKHAPSVHFTGIHDGQLFDFATPIAIQAFAYDAEDGSLDGPALQWAVTGPQAIAGSGGNIALSSLAPGLYTLTLTATDSDAQTTAESIQFTIRALAVADGAEPILDGLCGDPAYGNTPPVRLPYGGGLYANARFAHANGALFVCINGVHYGAGGAASSVGVRLNTFGALAGRNGAVGFAVDENGGLYRMSGDDSGLAFVSDPPAGYRVVILRDENFWSAELRIADELIGGWNHSLGVTVLADDGNGATAPVVWPPNSDVGRPSSWATGQAGPIPPLDDGNLLPFGSAEGLPGTDGNSASPLPGWTVTGNLSVVKWGAPGGFPAAADPGPAARGLNFFAGGPASALTTATTLLNVPYPAATIDAGGVQALLSGWLGGFGAQDDAVQLTVEMLDANGTALDHLQIGPVLAAERGGATALVQKFATRRVPAGTRQLRAAMQFTRIAGGYNDAYADELRLVLVAPASRLLNAPPLADAGRNRTLAASSGKTILALDGSGSSDPENSPLTFIWRETSGQPLTVSDAASSRPTVTVPAISATTTLNFELVVSDGLQESLPSRVSITLTPAPTATVNLFSGAFDSSTFVIRCDVDGNGHLQLQRTHSLSAPAWEDIGEVVSVTGGGVILRDESPPSDGQAFYRAILRE